MILLACGEDWLGEAIRFAVALAALPGALVALTLAGHFLLDPPA